MKCSNCGKEIANDSLFCEYCGAKIQKSRKKTLWIMLSACFIVCLFVSVISFGLGNNVSVNDESGEVASDSTVYDEEIAIEDVDSIAQGETEKVEVKSAVEEPCFKTGETWSYTEHSSEGNVTTYFVFTSLVSR